MKCNATLCAWFSIFFEERIGQALLKTDGIDIRMVKTCSRSA